MKWWWDFQRRTSSKNGEIVVYQRFGCVNIFVNECGQSTPYTRSMWKQCFAHLRKRHTPIKHILMLGLCGGSEVATLHRFFAATDVTVIEHDPVMVSLTRELALYKPFAKPEIIEGDAAQIVPTLTQPFDLIVVDMFDGPNPCPVITEDVFIEQLKHLLTPSGLLVVNVYKDAQYLDKLRSHFKTFEPFVFRSNTLGIFQ